MISLISINFKDVLLQILWSSTGKGNLNDCLLKQMPNNLKASISASVGFTLATRYVHYLCLLIFANSFHCCRSNLFVTILLAWIFNWICMQLETCSNYITDKQTKWASVYHSSFLLMLYTSLLLLNFFRLELMGLVSGLWKTLVGHGSARTGSVDGFSRQFSD